MTQITCFFKKQKITHYSKKPLSSILEIKSLLIFGIKNTLKILFLSLLYMKTAYGGEGDHHLCYSSLSSYFGPSYITNTFNNVISINLDNKNIYGLFTPHLTNQGNQILNFIQGDREETIKKLRILLRNQWDTVQSEKQDVSDIVNLLFHNPQIKWIAIEASEQEFETSNLFSINHLLQDYQEIKQLYTDVIKLDTEETDNLLHLIFPAYIIALSKNPELFQNIQFVPIEDSSLKNNAIILSARIPTIRENIIDTRQSRDIQFSFSEFQNIEKIQYGALENNEKIPETQITMILNSLSDEDLKSLVLRYFSSMNTFIEISSKRDKAIANNVLQQSGEGLILLGTAHCRGVITHLLSPQPDL